MGNSVIFSPAAAQRITNATKAVESERGDLSGRAPITLPESKQFWAKLTGEDGSNPGRYSFSKKFPSGFTFSASAPTFDISDYTAVEINGVSGLTDNYALLTFVGYDSSSPKKPIYFFSAGGASGVPIIPVYCVGNRNCGGAYQIHLGQWKTGSAFNFTTSSTFLKTDFAEKILDGSDNPIEATGLNEIEYGLTTHGLTALQGLPTGTWRPFSAYDSGLVDSEGYSIYIILDGLVARTGCNVTS